MATNYLGRFVKFNHFLIEMTEYPSLNQMTEAELLRQIGLRIRELRQQKNISQNDLAIQCDIQKASMSRIEAGKTNITMRTLHKILTALEADIKEFFRS